MNNKFERLDDIMLRLNIISLLTIILLIKNSYENDWDFGTVGYCPDEPLSCHRQDSDNEPDGGVKKEALCSKLCNLMRGERAIVKGSQDGKEFLEFAATKGIDPALVEKLLDDPSFIQRIKNWNDKIGNRVRRLAKTHGDKGKDWTRRIFAGELNALFEMYQADTDKKTFLKRLKGKDGRVPDRIIHALEYYSKHKG